jgi:hypothetical protein
MKRLTYLQCPFLPLHSRRSLNSILPQGDHFFEDTITSITTDLRGLYFLLCVCVCVSDDAEKQRRATEIVRVLQVTIDDQYPPAAVREAIAWMPTHDLRIRWLQVRQRTSNTLHS